MNDAVTAKGPGGCPSSSVVLTTLSLPRSATAGVTVAVCERRRYTAPRFGGLAAFGLGKLPSRPAWQRDVYH